MLLNSFVDWWNGINPYISFSATILSVFGLILSVVFFYKSRSIKQLSYAQYTNRVVEEDGISKLKFFYNGEEVSRLLMTKVVIWNTGTVVLSDADIITTHPIKISAPDGEKIYDVELINVSHQSNNFRLVATDSGSTELYFDYLNPDEGCVLRCFHSGTAKITGRLRGISRMEYRTVEKAPPIKWKRFSWFQNSQNFTISFTSAGVAISLMFKEYGIAILVGLLLLATVLTRETKRPKSELVSAYSK